MFAVQILSGEIFPLKPCDTGESVALFFSDWQVRSLPVVEGGKIIGFVREKDLLGREELKTSQIMNPEIQNYCVPDHTHLFDIWAKMQRSGLDTLAVCGPENQFLGALVAREINQVAFENSALMQEGSTLVLELAAVQYSLAEISRIIEGNDTRILHVLIESLKDEANTIRVSLKLNQVYLNHVMASLERFGYRILYTNSPADPNRTMDDRYNWLIKYLNV